MTSLVDQLRAESRSGFASTDLAEEAADRIAELESALRDIVATETYTLDFEALQDFHRRARAALGGSA